MAPAADLQSFARREQLTKVYSVAACQLGEQRPIKIELATFRRFESSDRKTVVCDVAQTDLSWPAGCSERLAYTVGKPRIAGIAIR